MGKQTVHEEVREILPWLVNESLGEKESLRVLAHLRECPECQRERDELQALQQVVTEDDGATGSNYRFAFKRLMSRIEAAEANRESTNAFEPEARSRRWLPFVGAAASLFLAVLFVAGVTTSSSAPEGFRTLSTPQPMTSGMTHRLALTFDQPIKAETLRFALIETGSNIVSGPDARGTYIVEVAVPGHLTDAEFLRSIRDIEGVRYAAFDSHTDRSR